MAELAQDWSDGFLVVGNQPTLDLLNTRLLLDGEDREMLTGTDALVRWLQVAALVAPAMRGRLRTWRETAEAKVFLRELLEFREVLRAAVTRLEQGKLPSRAFLLELNERLIAHPFRLSVSAERGRARTQQAEGASVADTLWAALLQEVVQLLRDADPARVRQCEGCMAHFEDVSKKSARRWCSMRLCGNKVKVAAYQLRQREAGRG